MTEVQESRESGKAINSDEKTRQVTEVAINAGIDVVGIAPAERWDDAAPEGHRPADILPGARSVVVLGTRGPTAGAWQSPDHRFMEVNGYDFRNDLIVQIVADFIEREFDHYAIMAPALSVSVDCFA